MRSHDHNWSLSLMLSKLTFRCFKKELKISKYHLLTNMPFALLSCIEFEIIPMKRFQPTHIALSPHIIFLLYNAMSKRFPVCV